jgi:hypothetical protein
MNTPKSTPPIRWPARHASRELPDYFPGGQYVGGLSNEQFAKAVGNVIVLWAHLEEAMLYVLEALLSDSFGQASRQIFRSVNSTQARIDIMQSLLESSPANENKGPQFDEIINEFKSLTKERNNCAHGLWFSHEDGQHVRRADPADPSFPSPFMLAQPVSLPQVEHVVKRIADLTYRVSLGHAMRWPEPSPTKQPPPG